jgi:hypothetical protein
VNAAIVDGLRSALAHDPLGGGPEIDRPVVSTTEVPMTEQNRLIILDATRITKRTLFVAAAHTEKTAL